MSENDTYEKPAQGWTCFHCGENFTTMGGARTHFGATPGAMPGCLLKVQPGEERGLLMELRKAEAELARYREEDTELHRQIASMEAGHQVKLREQEETGYNKGLKDGRATKLQVLIKTYQCGHGIEVLGVFEKLEDDKIHDALVETFNTHSVGGDIDFNMVTFDLNVGTKPK